MKKFNPSTLNIYVVSNEVDHNAEHEADAAHRPYYIKGQFGGGIFKGIFVQPPGQTEKGGGDHKEADDKESLQF